MKFGIIAGHGGSNIGAAANGLVEKNITLAVALEVEKLFKEYENVETVLPRRRDEDITLARRVQIVEKANCDAIVDIHINGHANTSVTGTETFHFHGSAQGKRLSDAIQGKMLAKWGRRNRGVKTANFYMLVNTSMPAVLTESDFLSNKDAANIMKRNGYAREYAECIVEGLAEVYKLKKIQRQSPNATTHTVRRGDTYWSIAQQYGVSVVELEKANPYPSNSLPVGSKVVIPSDGYTMHTIKSGDTYWSLSRQYNTTVEKIRAANPGVNENALSIGSKIRIPV